MIKLLKGFIGMLCAFIPCILIGLVIAIVLPFSLYGDFLTSTKVERNPFNYWPWEKMFWVKFLSI